MKVLQTINLALVFTVFLVLGGCNNPPAVDAVKTAKANTNVAPSQKTEVKTATPSFTKVPARTTDELEMNFPYDVEVMDADGKKVNTKDILGNGKPTAVLFWLTTCGPCKMKFSAIEKKYAKWKEETDFNMVAISVDWPKNTQRFRDMVKEKNWPWPVYHDFALEFKKIMPGNLNGLPQEFLFDKDGELIYHKKRYSVGAEDILYNKIKAAAE